VQGAHRKTLRPLSAPAGDSDPALGVWSLLTYRRGRARGGNPPDPLVVRRGASVANPDRMAFVLFVDDDRVNLTVTKLALRPVAGEFHMIESPEEALRFLEGRADCVAVVSDNAMPGMTGLQFLEEVRKRFPAIRRLMLTSNPDASGVVEAHESGLIQKLMGKPFSGAKLREVMVEQLANVSRSSLSS
jgi:CheY-like chemotaxis protein